MFYNFLASYPNNGYATSTTPPTSQSSTFPVILITVLSLAILITFGLIAQKEANKQFRDGTKWFWLGFFFGFNAFIALKISKAANEEGHSTNLWSVLGVFFGLTAVLAFEAGLNAENKQHDFDCWVLLGFAFGLITVFISCFLKPFEKKESKVVKNDVNVQAKNNPNGTWHCPKCGAVNLDSRSYCGVCGKQK